MTGPRGAVWSLYDVTLDKRDKPMQTLQDARDSLAETKAGYARIRAGYADLRADMALTLAAYRTANAYAANPTAANKRKMYAAAKLAKG